MHKGFTSRLLTIAALSLSLSACVAMPVQTDYDQQIQAQQQQLDGWSQQNSTVASAQNSLSDLLSSPELNDLLASAYQHNPNLQQTWLTLQIRLTELKQSQAITLPQIDATLGANKSEANTTKYNGSVGVSWKMDLWGKLDNAVRASQLDVIEQRLLYQSARDTLTSEVMNAWLGLIAQQHAIAIESERLATLDKNQQLILQRYRNGLGTLEDLDSARSAMAKSKASIEVKQQSLRQQQRDLQTLVGDLSLNKFSQPISYPEVKLALAELPAQTLARRPDLQAAYHQIKAAELRTKVAYQALLPSLDLGASLTQVATTPRQALLTSPVWTLLAELTAPLFHGGDLKAEAHKAELQTASSYQSYRQTLLNAVNEVEQALDLEQSLTTQQTHIKQALESEMNSLEQYQRSYRQGLVDILDLLNVQQQTYDLQAQYDNLVYQRLVNRINLGLALGLGVNS